jgi:hypothetical protein
MKRLINEKTIDVVDQNTGEVITCTTSKSYSIKTDTDEFYMSFIEFMQPFFDLQSTTDKNLIAKLCTRAEYNTGKVRITAQDRIDLTKELEVDKSTLSRSIKKLVEKQLISGERGIYFINPLIFWKGDTKTRSELLKKGLSITMEFKS